MRLSVHYVVRSLYKMPKVCFYVVCMLQSNHEHEHTKEAAEGMSGSVLQCTV